MPSQRKRARVEPMSTSPVQDPDSLLRRRLYQKIVTVKLGPVERGQKIFSLERDILISSSEYFKKMLTSGFVEGQTSVITLNDANDDVFCIACVWMYESRLAFVAENQDEALLALQTSYNTTSMRADLPETWPWKLLFDLYMFADRYCISNMKLAVVACLRRSSFEPDLDIITTAYDELPPFSKDFKEVLVERFIRVGEGPVTHWEYQDMPQEFVLQLVNESLKIARPPKPASIFIEDED